MKPIEKNRIDMLSPYQTYLYAGFLLGWANLIPGLSGGTVLLLMGVYIESVDSIVKMSQLKFERRRIMSLFLLGIGAICLHIIQMKIIAPRYHMRCGPISRNRKLR